MGSPTEAIILRLGADASAYNKVMKAVLADAERERMRQERIKDHDYQSLKETYRKQESLQAEALSSKIKEEAKAAAAIKAAKIKAYSDDAALRKKDAIADEVANTAKIKLKYGPKAAKIKEDAKAAVAAKAAEIKASTDAEEQKKKDAIADAKAADAAKAAKIKAYIDAATQRKKDAIADEVANTAKIKLKYGPKAAKIKEEKRKIEEAAKKKIEEAAKKKIEEDDDGGGLRSGVVTESLVMIREAIRGNYNRMAGSATILASKAGWMPAIVGALTNPITLAVAAVLATAVGTVVASISMTRTARELTQDSASVGMAPGSYESLIRQGRIDKGGTEGMKGMVSHLMGQAGEAGMGSQSHIAMFKRWKVAIFDANMQLLDGEKIYKNALKVINSMGDGIEKNAAAAQLLGANWRDMSQSVAQGMLKATETTRADAKAEEEGGKRSEKFWNDFKGTYSVEVSSVSRDLARSRRRDEKDKSDGLDGLALVVSDPVRRTGDMLNMERLQGRLDDQKRHPNQGVQGPPDIHGLGQVLMGIDTQKGIEFKQAERAKLAQENAVADRLAPSLESTAAYGRQFGGPILPRLYGMTGRMRTSIDIQNTEESGRLANMSDDGMFKGKTREQYDDIAKSMRQANPWLPAADRDILKNQLIDLAITKENFLKIVRGAEVLIQSHAPSQNKQQEP